MTEDNQTQRDRLFEPGRYLSLPLTIMARTDLAASAKLVWMDLAGHLGPRGASAWPSVARLCHRTGMGRNTVLRATEALEEAGLIVIDRSCGSANVYRLYQPEEGCDEKRSQNGTGPKMGRVESDADQSQNGTPTSPNLGHPSPILDTNQSQNGTVSTVLVTPISTARTHKAPSPDSAANACARSAAPEGTEGEETATAGHGEPTGEKMLTNERAAVEHVKTVYRVAYGGGLPWGWKGKIIEAYRDGLWSELAAIDAAAMPGSKAATPKDRTWGFGWLMRYVSGKLAEKAQTEAAQKRAQGSAANAAGQRAAQEEQRKADMAKRRAYFAALPEIKQQVYRQAAASQRFAPKGKPEIIEAMAAELAWQTSQELAEAREGQA